jgi:hypothetical protein
MFTTIQIANVPINMLQLTCPNCNSIMNPTHEVVFACNNTDCGSFIYRSSFNFRSQKFCLVLPNFISLYGTTPEECIRKFKLQMFK